MRVLITGHKGYIGSARILYGAVVGRTVEPALGNHLCRIQAGYIGANRCRRRAVIRGRNHAVI